MKRAVRQRYGAVIFDCDETLSEITGIDELCRDRRAVVIRHNSMAPVLALALDRAPHHEPGRSVYSRGAALLQANHSD